jgi:hypothetical protein
MLVSGRHNNPRDLDSREAVYASSLRQMARQKLLSRLSGLERVTNICVETKTIEVVFIAGDGSRSKTAEPLVFTAKAGANSYIESRSWRRPHCGFVAR